MKFLLMAVIALMTFVCAWAQNDAGQRVRIVWLGVVPGDHPAIEKRLGEKLGDLVRSNPLAEVVDAGETDRLKHHFGFSAKPVITANFVRALNASANDRTLVIWGQVSGYSHKIARTWWFFGADSRSDLSFSLSCYSLNFREYLFAGDILAVASRFETPVLFRSPELVVSVSAAGLSALDELLIADVLGKTRPMINGLCRVAVSRAGGGAVTVDNMRQEKASTAADIFEIPTIEAPSITVPAETDKTVP